MGYIVVVVYIGYGKIFGFVEVFKYCEVVGKVLVWVVFIV